MDEAAPPVVPCPSPTAVKFDLAQNAQGQTYVVMSCFTTLGVAVYFLETEIAFAVAKQMRSAAQQSQHQIMPVENKLVIPTNGQN